VRLVHVRDGTETTLARDVEFADTFLSRARGLMFRRRIDDDYALVFRFESEASRSLHMAFVPFDIDVLWLSGDRVTGRSRLSAWTGLDRGVADTIVELPAGAATGVAEGDRVYLTD
jgi:hypothetical protein